MRLRFLQVPCFARFRVCAFGLGQHCLVPLKAIPFAAHRARFGRWSGRDRSRCRRRCDQGCRTIRRQDPPLKKKKRSIGNLLLLGTRKRCRFRIDACNEPLSLGYIRIVSASCSCRVAMTCSRPHLSLLMSHPESAATSLALEDTVELPCGKRLPNRLVKVSAAPRRKSSVIQQTRSTRIATQSAMAEIMSINTLPNERLNRLYKTWSGGRFGMIISGPRILSYFLK